MSGIDGMISIRGEYPAARIIILRKVKSRLTSANAITAMASRAGSQLYGQ